MQRLYAVDIFPRMVDRLHISWVINFEMEMPPPKPQNRGNVVFFEQADEEFAPEAATVPPRVMVNPDTDTVFVSLPAPAGNGLGGTKFWAIKDNQTSSKPEILFKKNYALSSMATYEQGSNGISSVTRKEGLWKGFGPVWGTAEGRTSATEKVTPSVWAVDATKEMVLEISPNSGAISKSMNISSLLKSRAKVTSDLMVTRSNEKDEDHLVFAVTLVNGPSPAFHSLLRSRGMNKSENKNYVIQLKGETLEWIVPTAKDLPGIGQIAGIKTHDRVNDEVVDDLYVVFAGDSESSVVFSIH